MSKHAQAESTQASLATARELVGQHGPVLSVEHCESMATGPQTRILFDDGYVHVAAGFTAGQRGDGPQALLQLIHQHLGRDDLTIDQIAAWDEGTVYLVLPPTQEVDDHADGDDDAECQPDHGPREMRTVDPRGHRRPLQLV